MHQAVHVAFGKLSHYSHLLCITVKREMDSLVNRYHEAHLQTLLRCEGFEINMAFRAWYASWFVSFEKGDIRNRIAWLSRDGHDNLQPCTGKVEPSDQIEMCQTSGLTKAGWSFSHQNSYDRCYEKDPPVDQLSAVCMHWDKSSLKCHLISTEVIIICCSKRCF